MALDEKRSKGAIFVAARSAEISSAWTMNMPAGLEKASKTKEDLSAYASATAKLALGVLGDTTRLVANFVEIAGNLQNETLELVCGAGENL